MPAKGCRACSQGSPERQQRLFVINPLHAHVPFPVMPLPGPLRAVSNVELSQVGKERHNDEAVYFLQHTNHRALHPGMWAIPTLSSPQTCSGVAASESNPSRPCLVLPVSPSASSSPNSTAERLLGAELICFTGINSP